MTFPTMRAAFRTRRSRSLTVLLLTIMAAAVVLTTTRSAGYDVSFDLRARSSGRIAGSVRSDPGAPPLGDARTGSTPEHASWVVAENARSGSSSWRIPRSAPNSIEGFADVVSAQVGDDVTLYISTPARTFHVEAYRIGYYDGDGGRRIWRSRIAPRTRTTRPRPHRRHQHDRGSVVPLDADPHRDGHGRRASTC